MSTSNLYPFRSRNSIKEQLFTDVEFRKSVMVMLFDKQTQHEQNTASTLNKNKVGFMSSHAAHGTRIAKAIKAGEALTDRDHDLVDAIAPRYSRQVALFLREQAIAADPSLNEVARTFSAAVVLPEAPAAEEMTIEADDVVEADESETV